ncbi:MAG: hypothetical protein ACE5GM_02005 [bacterium]
MDRSKTSQYLILVLCGINLVIIQFVMIREFTAILYGEELIIVLVSAAYFSGWSVGYFISDYFSEENLKFYAYLTLVFHLSLPWSIRFSAARIYELGGRGWSLLAFLFAVSFLVSAFYSLFLPKFITEDDSSDAFQRMYSIGVIGTLLGIGLIFLVARHGTLPLLTTYYLVLAATISLLLRNYKLLISSGLIIFLIALFGAGLDKFSTEYVFRRRRNFKQVESLFRSYSPYQKIDIIKTGGKEHRLYLDGLQNFNSSRLTRINYYVAGLPARLYPFPRVLIMGSGSLSTVKYAAPRSRKITVVELDPMMAQASLDIFRPLNQLRADRNWKLVVDDGKHFLMSSPEKYNLVVMDVPSPYSIQEAVLHSKEFYQAVGGRLKTGGMISVHLSGYINRTYIAVRVCKALLAAFKDIYVIHCPDLYRDFAIAGNDLKFTADDIRKILKKDRAPERTYIYDRQEVLKQLPEEGKAISLDNMEVVLVKGWERLTGRFF